MTISVTDIGHNGTVSGTTVTITPSAGEALTAVAAVTVEAALQVALRSVADRRGEVPTGICVVAMGRFGGHESGYGSDADVMFVHDPLPGADEDTIVGQSPSPNAAAASTASGRVS